MMAVIASSQLQNRILDTTMDHPFRKQRCPNLGVVQRFGHRIYFQKSDQHFGALKFSCVPGSVYGNCRFHFARLIIFRSFEVS